MDKTKATRLKNKLNNRLYEMAKELQLDCFEEDFYFENIDVLVRYSKSDEKQIALVIYAYHAWRLTYSVKSGRYSINSIDSFDDKPVAVKPKHKSLKQFQLLDLMRQDLGQLRADLEAPKAPVINLFTRERVA